MDLLLTAATELEILPTIRHLQMAWNMDAPDEFSRGKDNLRILISGPGMLRTTYRLTAALGRPRCDWAIQAGIAGSFRRDLPPGTVVRVIADQPGDEEAQEGEGFLDMTDIGLIPPDDPLTGGKTQAGPPDPFPGIHELPAVCAISVNTVSGNGPTISQRMARYHPDIETMEGAAFHYVCLMEKIPFLQLRAISNFVGPRDKSAWDIPLACRELNKVLVGILEKH